MKKYISIIAFLVFAFTLLSAKNNKQRTADVDLTYYNTSVKSSLSIGGGSLTDDTIANNDTVTYYVNVSRADELNVAGQIKWKKVGAGHPVFTTYFYQSFDGGTTYVALKKGINRVAYTVVNTGVLSSDSSLFWSFKTDTVYFEGGKLKIQHRTSNVSTTKGVLTDYIRFNRK
jgi:hypothetical protein